MNHQQLNCSQHLNEKFQYLCFKEQCISHKPTQCQLFFCTLCYEELDENEQLLEHKLHHISVLNKVSKKSIFKNKQIIGDKLWQLIKEKNNGSLMNFENECVQINQKFDQIKKKYLEHINTIQVHFQNLKYEINEQLDQINKNINVKMDECRNLQNPVLITKLTEKKTQDFQKFLSELSEEPKESIQYYRSTFQNQLKNLRKNTKSLMIATEFSKKIKEQKQEQQEVYFQLSDLNNIQASNFQTNNSKNNNSQQNQLLRKEQNNNDDELDFDEQNIQLLKFNEIKYSEEIGTQINNKIQEFKDYMQSLLEVCQIQSQPFEQVLQDNFEIKQQFQYIIKQMQQNKQYDNNSRQQTDQINTQKQIIHQYTDSVKFLEDFPDINNQQQYKKLSQRQINAITDLRVQLGLYYDLKNLIPSYGYNSLGKQGIKEINEIIFNNLDLKNLQNLSLNYFNSKLSIQEYLQMINQLGSWQLTPQIRKLSLGYQNNYLDQQKVSQIIQQLFGTQKLENLQELELLFQQNYISNLEIFSSQLINILKKVENQFLSQQDENLNKQQSFQNRQEQLKEFKFYLYNLEKIKIDLTSCNINNEKLSKIMEQIALFGVCMPKISFLEIYLHGNKEISDEGINTFSQTLANSSLLKNLRTISLNFNQIENISDDSLIQLSEILISKGKNLDAVYLYIWGTSVTSQGVKKISEILCKKQLQKLLLDFYFNDQLNGQEIIDLAKALSQTKYQIQQQSL
ncbi:hypothetical protein PPERSA_07356 [Pseudocohnilembus persalinus]|uniref:C2H2-type domain-containing protein n=1 Tax=Pseudocohnilembus persalinus TaxID=266149 RepID=A0A0V0Q8M0_PSEPJ|nr:hypothetical protein PPERSA_07356 [Pseudocohnilembus persalinus]|eukprot:KRW98542.1 hypothetical protein PPERSA_07356 [Pseudocohnilembus persalinus]